MNFFSFRRLVATGVLGLFCASNLPAQSAWTGNALLNNTRWYLPGNWSNSLPPITPLQDALFQDINGSTNVRVVGILGGSVTASPRSLEFINVDDNYTITTPSGSSLRPQAIIVNGSGDITFTGNGTLAGQLLTLGELTIEGSGTSTLTVNTIIANGALGLPTVLVHERTGGETILQRANTYTGGTQLNSGTLVVANSNGLGSGTVQLQGGILQPTGTASISNLEWSDGQIALDLNGGASLAIDGDFANAGNGGTFLLNNLTIGNSYTLATFSNAPGFLVSDFSAITSVPDLTLNGSFIFDPTSSLVYELLSITATGAILQNSNPSNIPAVADFLVAGAVSTGSVAESNTINSLIFENGSSLQVFNTLTVTSGTFTAEGGVGTITGGTIAVPGDFVKDGSGTLITNTNIVIGTFAELLDGGLIVNGQLTAPGGLEVFQGALLGGSGIIIADVFNNGTVSPGNSPGTLVIQGNYVQGSDGTLQLEIASPTVFDRLVVSGLADLAGTLAVSVDGAALRYGQQYAFLQAGEIVGDFDSIVMPNPELFRGRFLVDGNTGTLLVAPTSYTLVATTPNQVRVARALDSFIPAEGNDRETVSIALDIQSENAYPVAFDQIAPTFHESIANLTLEQAFAQTQLLNQRLSGVRLGAAAGFSNMPVENESTVSDKNKTVLQEQKFLPGWSLWTQGNGMFAKVTNVSQVPNYRFNSGGFLFGVDRTIGQAGVSATDGKSFGVRRSHTLTFGAFGGYQGTYADYSGGGSTTVNSALFGGYASYTNRGFYMDAVVGGGYNAYAVRRTIEFSTIDRTARSRQNGGQLSTALNFGYDWEIGNFTAGPIAGVQYTYAGIAPFTEQGADSLNLRVSQQNANSLRTTFGGRVAYTWNLTERVILIPEVRMFWLHEFLNNPRIIGAALDGGSGVGFDYLTSTPDRDSVFAGTGVTAQVGERWNASAFWNTDFGRQDLLSHIVSFNLAYQF